MCVLFDSCNSRMPPTLMHAWRVPKINSNKQLRLLNSNKQQCLLTNKTKQSKASKASNDSNDSNS